MKKFFLISAVIGLASCNSIPQLSETSIDDVVGAMTLEEKAHLVVGYVTADATESDNAMIGSTSEIVPGAAGTTYGIPRLGIPSIVFADGPAGLRIDSVREGSDATYYCTHFPIGTLLACTWNEDLVERVGQAMGNEVLEYGVDILLAPGLNIHRNPLCGRNFEYYSEDPVVSGKIAAAYVRGVQSNGVGTSVKHLVANNQEGFRRNNNAQVSPRALREIYLKGFEIAVKESNPWTVMSSYNLLNGTYTSEREDLITTVLRDEWGYSGMVVTDWNSGKDAVAQMQAGTDMLQPGFDYQIKAILSGVEDGSLDESALDRNVRRILEMIVKTPRFKGYSFSNDPDLSAHAEVTRSSSTEGMVLLKNDNDALPLSGDIKNVALFGNSSYNFIAGGIGSGGVNHAYVVSLLEGLSNAGLSADEELKGAYSSHVMSEMSKLMSDLSDPIAAYTRFLSEGFSELDFGVGQISEIARRNDAALITIGRNTGEGIDRNTSNFNVSSLEQKLIKNVCSAFHAQGKKVIVILNIGGVIETASWKTLPDAILCAWQGGQEGGNSVADILKGNANPSGKLTMTFPIKLADNPSTSNFPVDEGISMHPDENEKKLLGGKKNIGYTTYEEDIYVGYRYFDSFGKKVSYPFGYGLSYTTFEYANASVSEDDGVYTVTVDVKNTGKREGKEVVQLYVAAPESKAMNKPVKELKAFAKTGSLKPGETAKVTMSVDATALASYNEERSAWVVDAGKYDFLVGASSADIRASLEAEVSAAELKTNDVLKLEAPIERLTRVKNP